MKVAVVRMENMKEAARKAIPESIRAIELIADPEDVSRKLPLEAFSDPRAKAAPCGRSVLARVIAEHLS